MKKGYLFALLNLFFLFASAQMISLDPTSAGADDSVVLTFDASEGNGELAGADKVYIHHGVVTDLPDGTSWQHVIGNWGEDDGVGEMTPVPGEPNKWQIEFTPSIRAYFGVPGDENIFRISCVFRSPDGSTKGTLNPGSYPWGETAANQDNYIDLNTDNYIIINQPTSTESFVYPGQPIPISATASSPVNSMKIWIDEGSGYEEKASVSSGTTISHSYQPSSSGQISIKVTATIGNQGLEIIQTHNVGLVSPPIIAPLPPGIVEGINYNAEDDTEATLVLQAPGKSFVYLVGDFNNWTPSDNYQMKKTPNGEHFWLEISGLTPQQQYVFQYWVEGSIKIGDPYAQQVADPWNDPFIDPATFPNIPAYDHPEWGIATVLQTGQEEYTWAASEASWERPDLDHLVIYELLVRDFLGSHSYEDLIDTLSYIKNLGVDAIEIMPFNEFEGNESWGYNPNYYFAHDKYYGPAEDLKRLIETCHQMGMAVIMDMVLNHAYGTNPMVRLYFDESVNKPAVDNPWFNRDYVGPFQWGYDFDHESQYTKDFMDRVNGYWIENFHIDGYRFDFTKGFTNYAPGGNIDGFDQSRIDILKRMADEIWDVDPDAYIILEHWGPPNEEQQLSDHGMKMWRNRSYDYVPGMIGNNGGNLNNMGTTTHVTYHNSHDERRIAEHALTEGLSNGGYDVKNPLVMYERVKMMTAFTFLFPGPKMLWQFDELGYDIDINFNGRVGNKPLPWGPDGLGYYEDPLRQHIYSAYQGILDVRKQIGAEAMANASTDHQVTGPTRRLSFDTDDVDLVVIGNFNLETETIIPEFTQTGTWYDYFSGDSITVINPTAGLALEAGEWHIYTTERLSDGMPGVVEIYSNPVTITPTPFTQFDEITIRFEAAKAFPNGTAGLVGAEKVYLHSGVVLSHPDSTNLENIVGTLTDDRLGLMTEVEEDIWEITLTMADYYGLMEDDEAYKIGMYFRDADNANVGMGFRNSVIYFDVESTGPFITVEPADFTIDDEITITFNARRGNGELIGFDKVYMHSSVDLSNTTTPWNSAWNNVVGNWGNDDGVGQMSKVTSEDDLWEITLTPRNYYGLNDGDVAYWLAMVFRSADGNTKGTGTPGPIENGLIHTNQDFFIQNQIIVDTDEPGEGAIGLRLFPNPTDQQVQIEMKGNLGNCQVELIDATGRNLQLDRLNLSGTDYYLHRMDLVNYPSGLYFIQVTTEDGQTTKQVVKW